MKCWRHAGQGGPAGDLAGAELNGCGTTTLTCKVAAAGKGNKPFAMVFGESTAPWAVQVPHPSLIGRPLSWKKPRYPVESGSGPCGLFQKKRSVAKVRSTAALRLMNPRSTPTG